MSDVIHITPLEQRQVDVILNRVGHVQRVVHAIRIAARDLDGGARIRIEGALSDAVDARAFDRGVLVEP